MTYAPEDDYLRADKSIDRMIVEEIHDEAVRLEAERRRTLKESQG